MCLMKTKVSLGQKPIFGNKYTQIFIYVNLVLKEYKFGMISIASNNSCIL